LRNPMQRAAWATSVSLSTVSRVRSEDLFNGLPESGKQERRDRVPLINVAEIIRLREVVYSQYRNRSLPSLDSTLEYLKTEILVHSATGIGSASSFVWTRTKLALAMKEAGFYFSRGPNHYDVAREDPEIKDQRSNYIDTVRQYRRAGRTIYYNDETWANKNMSVYRSWSDGTLNSRIKVPSGKGGRIIIAHMGSRETSLVEGASLVFIGKKKPGDYHYEMNYGCWLEWLSEDVFPKIRGGVLVIDRAPYHLVRTEDTRPANTKMRKAEVPAWLRAHDCVPQEWEGNHWEKNKVNKELLEEAAKNRPAPRYLVQDLSKEFEISILMALVAHSEPNPIEMVWVTVKMALKRANIDLSLTALQALVAEQFSKMSTEEWPKYELYAIKIMENYREVGEVSAAVEEALWGRATRGGARGGGGCELLVW